MELIWILEKREHPKFPYKITIKQDKDILLSLLAQDRWPGQKGNIFCIRANSDDSEGFTEVERVPIVSFNRFGKRISIVLDRAVEKRCDFIFLIKKYKTREGEYEQIFWKTQKAISENRPKLKLSTYYKGNMDILIDVGERYFWRFPNCNITKEKLPVGDYALKGRYGILAIVERKTFENLVSEFSKMMAFHQQLGELTAYKNSALVIEANYSDFLKPEKLKYYSPTFAVKAIAELYAYHPSLSIVFAGNRKLANEWTYRYFMAISANEKDFNWQVADPILKYEHKKEKYDYFGLMDKIKEEIPLEFNIKKLNENFPEIDSTTLKKIIKSFVKKNIIKKIGKGIYQKISNIDL